MLITFKSRASGNVIMFEENGKELLNHMGKDPDAGKGIVTAVQLPGAIAALRAAMEADRSTGRKPPDNGEEADHQPDEAVQLAQRALPLLELLERSLQESEPVTWGV